MNSKQATLYQCEKCKAYYLQKDIADSCCTDSAKSPAQPSNKCACGIIIPEYWTKCDACREKEIFDKAEKIKESAWTEAVYAEGYGDEFFETIAEFHDYVSDTESVYPKYVYATRKIVWKGLDADDILENEMEEFHEDAIEYVVAIDELKAFLKDWNAKQSLFSYEADLSKAILIDLPEIEKTSRD